MPAELFHLFTTGHLMAWERQQYGFLPLMMCADCEGIPVDLIWKHKPVSVNHFTSAAIQKRQKSSKRQKPLPGSTWGSDVAVICRCCSFGGKCPHKKAIDALKTVKAGDDWQGVKQGVQR